MRPRRFVLAVALLVASALAADTTTVSSGTARRVIRAASLPAACSVSDVYFKTAATVGLNVCLTANNWSAVTIGGITEAAADLKYLQLAGGTMTGKARAINGTEAAPSIDSAAGAGLFFTAAALGVTVAGETTTICGVGCAAGSGGTFGWSDTADATGTAGLKLTRVGAKQLGWDGATAGAITHDFSGLTVTRIVTWPDIAGTIAFTSSNVATATALAADPAGCTNQFASDIAANGTLTCRSVADADLSLTTPALGTPSSGVATNLTGTAAGLTAGTVTTNANLTGPITSVGNATAVASQTGTGSTFVMNTSPTLATPALGVATATSINGNVFTTGTYTLTGSAAKVLTFNNTLTLTGTDGTTMTFPSTSATVARTDASNQFTGNQGVGVAPSGVTGEIVKFLATGNHATFLRIDNTDASSTASYAGFDARASTARIVGIAYGAGNTTSRYGLTLGSYNELLAVAGNGLILGTLAGPVVVAPNTAVALTITTTNHQVTSGTAPSLTSCGTGATVAGNDTNGRITVGTGGFTACVVTFAAAYATAPVCYAADEITVVAFRWVPTTTTLTINGAALVSDTVTYHCEGY